MGFEPMISGVTGQRIKPDYANTPYYGAVEENRTPNHLLGRQRLYLIELLPLW